MKYSRCCAVFASAGLIATLAATDPAQAAAPRTFVSATGVDNLACSITAPCRTFTAAVTATAKRGEVIVLDSGGYGQVTITQSLSIIAVPGVYAGVSVSSGDGITITISSGDSVTLRGLSINNVASGNRGILFDGDGHLQLDDIHVSGFPGGGLIFVPPASGDVTVQRSTFAYDGGWGIVIGPATLGNAVIERTIMHHNNMGLQVSDGARVIVRGCSAVFNFGGIFAYSQVPGSTPEVIVESSNLSNNGIGALIGSIAGPAAVSLINSTIADNSSGVEIADAATLTLAGTSIVRNHFGLTYSGSASAFSQGNNLIYGNVLDGAPPTVVGSK
jgi:hypothetical protein